MGTEPPWVPRSEGRSPAPGAPQSVIPTAQTATNTCPTPGERPQRDSRGHGEVGTGFSSDSNSLHLVPNPGAKAGTARTSQEQGPRTHCHDRPASGTPLCAASAGPRGTGHGYSPVAVPGGPRPSQLGTLGLSPDFSSLTRTVPGQRLACWREGMTPTSRSAPSRGCAVRVPTPHPRTPLWPSKSSHSGNGSPVQDDRLSGGRRPGFPQRPWAPRLQALCLKEHLWVGPTHMHPLDLRPTMTLWAQNLSARTRKLMSPSLSHLPPCPPWRRTLWRQGPIPTAQAGRGGLNASLGSLGNGGVPLPPTPQALTTGHFQVCCTALGGPPRPGRLQTHTEAAGARAADLWP